MTIYRRWPDMQALLADLMVREWGGLLAAAPSAPTGPGRQEIVDGVVAVVTALRQELLLRKIVEVDPEVLLPYLL